MEGGQIFSFFFARSEQGMSFDTSISRGNLFSSHVAHFMRFMKFIFELTGNELFKGLRKDYLINMNMSQLSVTLDSGNSETFHDERECLHTVTAVPLWQLCHPINKTLGEGQAPSHTII